MDKEGRRPGRRHGRGNLIGDVSAFAHPGNDDPAFDPLQRIKGRAEPIIKPVGCRLEAGGFNLEDPPGSGEVTRIFGRRVGGQFLFVGRRGHEWGVFRCAGGAEAPETGGF
jgi:hypothetical protein